MARMKKVSNKKSTKVQLGEKIPLKNNTIVLPGEVNKEDELLDDLLLREHEYRARQLTRGDNKKLRKLIIKYSDTIGSDDILNLKTSEENEENEEKLNTTVYAAAFGLFKEMLNVIETDIVEWFAELIGVTIEKFDTLPFDIEMDIIDDIITQRQFKSFFFKGSQAYKTILKLVNRIKR